jgi:hypothetical protein
MATQGCRGLRSQQYAGCEYAPTKTPRRWAARGVFEFEFNVCCRHRNPKHWPSTTAQLACGGDLRVVERVLHRPVSGQMGVATSNHLVT